MTVKGVQPVSLVMSSAVLPPEYPLEPPMLPPPPLPLVGVGAGAALVWAGVDGVGSGRAAVVVVLEPEPLGHQYENPHRLVQMSRLWRRLGAAREEEARVTRIATVAGFIVGVDAVVAAGVCLRRKAGNERGERRAVDTSRQQCRRSDVRERGRSKRFTSRPSSRTVALRLCTLIPLTSI